MGNSLLEDYQELLRVSCLENLQFLGIRRVVATAFPRDRVGSI